MPATDRMHPRRPMCTLVGLLALVACASNQPEPVQRGPAPQPSADLPLAEPSPAPALESPREALEASLAAYEQQLASNEDRLRAMGVRLAQRSNGDVEEKNAVADDRFAAPPPPVADGDSATRSERSGPGRAKKAPSRKSAPPADESPSTAPPAPAAPATKPQSTGSGRAARDFTSTKPTEAINDERQQPGRCSELCELASSTCELEAKICELAARHLDEPRYDAVCQRADEDCRIASEACNLCSP